MTSFTDMLAAGYGFTEPAITLGSALEGGTATVGVLLRKLVELEAQGAERFFGEPEFDVHEAHLLFDDAPKAFLDQIQRVVRLIRSKGVGVYLVTQTPKDVPTDVLAQLGNRIQHALRAHTPDDDKALKATVRTYPKTEFYDLEETLTSLGTGEAVITILDAKGRPTPVVAARLIPPASRMAPLSPEELQADIRQSDLLAEYGQAVDRESAREMLAKRMSRTEPQEARKGSAGRTAVPLRPLRFAQDDTFWGSTTSLRYVFFPFRSITKLSRSRSCRSASVSW
jgi:DNA helicase HerA-like ATPase